MDIGGTQESVGTRRTQDIRQTQQGAYETGKEDVRYLGTWVASSIWTSMWRRAWGGHGSCGA